MTPDTVQLPDGRKVPVQSAEAAQWMQSLPEGDRQTMLALLGGRASTPAPQSPGSILTNVATNYAGKETAKVGLEAIAGSSGAAPLYVPAAVAAATILGGRSALNELQGKTDNSLPGKVGRASLGIATGGLSELARPFFQKSTKDMEQERWGDLINNKVSGAEAAYQSAHGDPSGIWQDGAEAGKEWNWEDARNRAMAKPSEFRGVYGNFDAFGDKWSGAAPELQDKVVSELLNRNLYDPEKGDITISDKEQANQIFDEFAKNQIQPMEANTGGAKPSSGGGGGGKSKEKKPREPKLDLSLLQPSYTAPRYDIDLSPIYKNPYL